MSDPNENRPGYKETKVGWIPEEWDCRRIGEECTLINGRGFKPHEWGSTGLPIIRIQNLKGSKEFNYYSGEFNPKLLVESGQLLFAWSGSKGASFGPHIWRGSTGLLNYHTWKVVLNPEVEKRFFLEILQHITTSIESDAHGAAALVHVQKTWMENYLIPYPTFPEQKEIANILSTCNDAIEKTGALIDAKKRQKKALMQQLLTGKKRLPGFEGEWTETPLSELVSESREPGSRGSTARKLTVKLYGRGVIEKRETQAGSDATQYYQRKAGQLIYSKLDFLNGAFGIVPPALDGFESTLDLPAFDISPEMYPEWLLCYVVQPSFYKRWFPLANGGRKARRINPSDFKHIRLRLPPLEEQKAIADLNASAAAELSCLKDKHEALKQQKKALMQKLLTGQVRVKV